MGFYGLFDWNGYIIFKVPCLITFVFLNYLGQQEKVLKHKKNDHFVFSFYGRCGLFPQDFVQVSV